MKQFFSNIRQYLFDTFSNDFSKFSPAKQRIMVAKDVLAQLAAQRFLAKKSVYVRNLGDLRGKDVSIQDNFNKIKDCEVCAIGACLLSTVKFKNKLHFSDIPWGSDDFAHSRTVFNTLSDLFSPEQLAIIEAAFECGYNYVRLAKQKVTYLEDEIVERCKTFYYTYETDDDRLKAIMQNIIDNKGTFIP